MRKERRKRKERERKRERKENEEVQKVQQVIQEILEQKFFLLHPTIMNKINKTNKINKKKKQILLFFSPSLHKIQKKRTSLNSIRISSPSLHRKNCTREAL